MAETVQNIKARMFTHHGKKKNQGEWAIVNGSPALTYVEGKDNDKTVVGYTTFDEMARIAFKSGLPQYQLDF